MNGVANGSPNCEIFVRCDGNTDSFRLKGSLCGCSKIFFFPRFIPFVSVEKYRIMSFWLVLRPNILPGQAKGVARVVFLAFVFEKLWEFGTKYGPEAGERISGLVFRLLTSSPSMHAPSLDQPHTMSDLTIDSTDGGQLIRQPSSIGSVSQSTNREPEASDNDHANTEAQDVENSEDAIENPQQHRGDYIVIQGSGIYYNRVHRQNSRQNHHQYHHQNHQNYHENYQEIRRVVIDNIVINREGNSPFSEKLTWVAVGCLFGFASGALLAKLRKA
ncbi:hypothetical protein K449DRAFT_130492 [Hypoxylon sp. EC38]|nr:hypothetical protein K449DRAFT_130492 [Hypoxylon sp. EC38]